MADQSRCGAGEAAKGYIAHRRLLAGAHGGLVLLWQLSEPHCQLVVHSRPGLSLGWRDDSGSSRATTPWPWQRGHDWASTVYEHHSRLP